MTYLRYTPEVEVRQPDEDRDTQQALAAFGRLRQKIYEKDRHAVRDAHAKSHGVLKGELEVLAGLPPELAQGVFGAPRSYPVLVRVSTAPGEIGHDGVAALRGVALKLFGVEGERLSGMFDGASTQDFLMTNHPTIPTGDVKSYARQALLIERITGLPPVVQRIGTSGTRLGGALLRTVGMTPAGGPGGLATPLTHPLGQHYYSMAALRYGEHVAKVCLSPASPEVRALSGTRLPSRETSSIRDAVVDFFAHHDAEYDLTVQLCTDLERMPVEDASVRWPEQDSPYRPVARLRLPTQEAFSPARRTYADDVLSFSPWNGITAHQPLGSIMRVRKAAYEQSSRYRHEMNARPMVEPANLTDVPD